MNIYDSAEDFAELGQGHKPQVFRESKEMKDMRLLKENKGIPESVAVVFEFDKPVEIGDVDVGSLTVYSGDKGYTYDAYKSSFSEDMESLNVIYYVDKDTLPEDEYPYDMTAEDFKNITKITAFVGGEGDFEVVKATGVVDGTDGKEHKVLEESDMGQADRSLRKGNTSRPDYWIEDGKKVENTKGSSTIRIVSQAENRGVNELIIFKGEHGKQWKANEKGELEITGYEKQPEGESIYDDDGNVKEKFLKESKFSGMKYKSVNTGLGEGAEEVIEHYTSDDVKFEVVDEEADIYHIYFKTKKAMEDYFVDRKYFDWDIDMEEGRIIELDKEPMKEGLYYDDDFDVEETEEEKAEKKARRKKERLDQEIGLDRGYKSMKGIKLERKKSAKDHTGRVAVVNDEGQIWHLLDPTDLEDQTAFWEGFVADIGQDTINKFGLKIDVVGEKAIKESKKEIAFDVIYVDGKPFQYALNPKLVKIYQNMAKRKFPGAKITTKKVGDKAQMRDIQDVISNRDWSSKEPMKESNKVTVSFSKDEGKGQILLGGSPIMAKNDAQAIKNVAEQESIDISGAQFWDIDHGQFFEGGSLEEFLGLKPMKESVTHTDLDSESHDNSADSAFNQLLPFLKTKVNSLIEVDSATNMVKMATGGEKSVVMQVKGFAKEGTIKESFDMDAHDEKHANGGIKGSDDYKSGYLRAVELIHSQIVYGEHEDLKSFEKFLEQMEKEASKGETR